MRKSASMLKVGMKVVIAGYEQVITAIERDDESERVVITCGDNVYRRTRGAKIDVISRQQS